MLTDVDRVVFALYFLQADGRMAVSSRDVAAALKKAGCSDVRRLGLSYGRAVAEGLIAQQNGGYRLTPLGAAWAQGWIGS